MRYERPTEPGAECKHGHLARKCQQCDAEDDIGNLKASLALAEKAIEVKEQLNESLRRRDDEQRVEITALRERCERLRELFDATTDKHSDESTEEDWLRYAIAYAKCIKHHDLDAPPAAAKGATDA